jgi:hypothetical protein
MSCRGHSRKFRAYTKKELETARVTPELLDAPTIGGGNAQPGGDGGGNQRSLISLPSRPGCTKTAPKRPVPSLIDLKNDENTIFYLKVLIKIYCQDFFEEYINFKIFRYLRLCGIIPVKSFGSHICLQPPGFGLMQLMQKECI